MSAEVPGVEPEAVDAAAAPREQVARALSGYLSEEQLAKLIDSALAIEKQAWGSCRGCGKSVKVAVPDAKAVVSSVAELLNQGYGRPDAGHPDRALSVTSITELVCEEGHPCPTCEAEGKNSRSGYSMVNGEVVSREAGLDAAA